MLKNRISRHSQSCTCPRTHRHAVTNTQPHATSYHYDSAVRLAARKVQAGNPTDLITQRYGYDSLERPAQIKYLKAEAAVANSSSHYDSFINGSFKEKHSGRIAAAMCSIYWADTPQAKKALGPCAHNMDYALNCLADIFKQ